MTTHTYTRKTGHGSVAFAKTIEDAFTGNPFKVCCSGTDCIIVFNATLTAGEKVTLDSLATSFNDAAQARIEKFESVDQRTEELIEGGFIYEGKVFSLSEHAQAHLTGIYQVRDEVGIAYPIVWNLLDDESGSHDLVSADEVKAFYLVALGTIRVHLDGGTTIKELVRAATTREAVEAIVDGR